MLTQSGRTAIALVRDALGLAVGDEVIVPAYNCGTEVDALLAAGLQIRCIDCSDTGFLTLESLSTQVGPKTRAIYVIHLFGWPQPLEDIDKWRKSRGLFLVEDCALAPFSRFPDGSRVGTKGDASVFSFPKTLAVPDGGAISWNTDWGGPGLLSPPPRLRTFRRLASREKNWLRRRFVRPGTVVSIDPRDHVDANDGMPDMPEDYYFEPWRMRRASSGLTVKLLSNCDPDQVTVRRRNNYRVLSELLGANGFDLLFHRLIDGVAPLSCPIRVNGRDAAAAALAKISIATSPWWAGGHRKIDWTKFPIASELKRTILPLPVHQQLDRSDMEAIAAAVVASAPRCF